MVPILETERLILRAHAVADFDDMVATWSDEATTRYTVGRPSTPEEVWGRLHRYAGHWALLGFGYWAWAEKSSGRFIGEGGFADFKRALSPPLDAPEHGWTLAPWAHRQGFAREALSAQLRWGETHFARTDFVCLIAPENARSIRLAEDLGYRAFAQTEYKGEPELLFRRA